MQSPEKHGNPALASASTCAAGARHGGTAALEARRGRGGQKAASFIKWQAFFQKASREGVQNTASSIKRQAFFQKASREGLRKAASKRPATHQRRGEVHARPGALRVDLSQSKVRIENLHRICPRFL
jgi:hypothetical protein